MTTPYLQDEPACAPLVADLDERLPWWRHMSEVRQEVFVDLVREIGIAEFLTFRTFLEYAEHGEYSHAGLDLLGTAAAREYPGRYPRLAHQMSSGVRQP